MFSQDGDDDGFRRSDYKKSMDSEDTRRQREDSGIQLRKQRREQQVRKRRLMAEDMLDRFNQNKAYDDPSVIEKVRTLRIPLFLSPSLLLLLLLLSLLLL